MDDVLTHELIHAFDACRVKYDRNNLKHLACTSVGVLDFFFFCLHSSNFEAVVHFFKREFKSLILISCSLQLKEIMAANLLTHTALL